MNTEQLAKKFPNLVQILALPQILLVNSPARQTSSKIQNLSVHGKSPSKHIKLDIYLLNSWLTKSLRLDKWRHAVDSAGPVKNSLVKDQKLDLRCNGSVWLGLLESFGFKKQNRLS